MNRRAGISLAEVLIAMFVLTLGLLGVMSLFPLGAVRMAQAIKDDRCQNHNLNTAALFHVVWKFETVNSTGIYRQMYPPYYLAGPNPTPTLDDTGDRIDPFTVAMENPNFAPNPDGQGNDPDSWIPQAYQSPIYPLVTQPPTPPTTSPNAVVSRGSPKKSYSVLVDPIGWNNGFNRGSTMQYWIAGGINQTTHQQTMDSIPRRSLRRIEWLKDTNQNNPTAGLYVFPIPAGVKQVLRNRYMILLEDISFARDGTPMDSSGNYSAATPPPTGTGMNNQVQRDGRYSCALMFRRPQTYVHRQLEMTVVVYSGRAIDGPSEENAFTTRFVKGSTEATVYYDLANGPKPKIRKNTWLLDGTMVWQKPAANGAYDPAGPLVPDNEANKDHGVFYRVVDVVEDTEVVGGNTFGVFRVQLQEPAHSNSFYNDANLTPYGLGVVMDNVVEVFPPKLLSPITRPVP